jgi:protein SCO1/2
VLRAFVANFHPRLIGLTGTAADVGQAARAHGVYFSRRAAAQNSSAYLVDHMRTMILYGPEGEPIVMLPAEQGAEAVAATLDRWVR